MLQKFLTLVPVSALISLAMAGAAYGQSSTEDKAVIEARREIIRLEMEVERLSPPLATSNPALKAAIDEAKNSSLAMMEAIADDPSLQAARLRLSETEQQMASAMKAGDQTARAAADDAVRKATEALYNQAYAIPAIAALRDASADAGKRLSAAREAAVASTADGKSIVEKLIAARAVLKAEP
ncbi:MAG: hypothetical protein ACKO2G_15140 [Verrucomicrobiales bacterium]